MPGADRNQGSGRIKKTSGVFEMLVMVGIDLSARRELFEHLQLDGPRMNADIYQGLDRLKNLEELTIYSCQSLIRPDLSQLTCLKLLMASTCHNLIEIIVLERLKTWKDWISRRANPWKITRPLVL